jgi:CRISPR-associated endonuclease Cas1
MHDGAPRTLDAALQRDPLLKRASGGTWQAIWDGETSAGSTALSFERWYTRTRQTLSTGPLKFDPVTGILEAHEFGAVLTFRRGAAGITCGGTEFSFGPRCKVTAVHLSRPASISTPAICALAKQGIGLTIWQRQGAALRACGATTLFEYNALGDTRPAAVRMRLRLYELACDERKSFAIARMIVVEKLKRHGADRIFKDRVKDARSLRELMLVEAHGTRSFWSNLSIVRAHEYEPDHVGAAVRQRGRTRKSKTPRYATDPVNAAINYVNAVAAGRILQELISIGADPAVGFLHRKGLGLVYDCLELVRAELATAVWGYGQQRDPNQSANLRPEARRDLARLAFACGCREAVSKVLKLASAGHGRPMHSNS